MSEEEVAEQQQLFVGGPEVDCICSTVCLLSLVMNSYDCVCCIGLGLCIFSLHYIFYLLSLTYWASFLFLSSFLLLFFTICFESKTLKKLISLYFL